MRGSMSSSRLPHPLSHLIGLIGILLVVAAAGIFWYVSQARQSQTRVTDDVRMRLESLLPSDGDGFSGISTNGEGDSRIPSLLIDDVSYMGIVSVPSVGLNLPVRTSEDSGSLQVAPYRYAGTPTTHLIFVGWDSEEQFGSLSRVGVDDHVEFVDVDGISYSYHVNSLSTPRDFKMSDEIASIADLTLCAYDSASGHYFVVLASRD